MSRARNGFGSAARSKAAEKIKIETVMIVWKRMIVTVAMALSAVENVMHDNGTARAVLQDGKFRLGRSRNSSWAALGGGGLLGAPPTARAECVQIMRFAGRV